MTINVTILHLTVYLVCWFFTTFEPIQDGIDFIFERLHKNALTNSFWQLFGCQYCLTFWLTLGVTNNIIVALSLSAISQIHSKFIK